MEKKKITEEEFRRILKKHDWFYNMSDDPSVWMRGNKERTEIENLTKDNPNFAKIYKEEGDRIFNH
jgi:hypothetical protein